MSVRLPRWITAGGVEIARLHPASLAVELSATDPAKATLALPASETAPAIHDLVELYTARGSAGIFRVVSMSYSYAETRTLQLIGATDTLTDDIYPESPDNDISHTPAEWIGLILAQQTVERWQLGTCDSTRAVKLKPNYQALWTMLESVRTAEHDLWWVPDYTTTPWTLNLRRLSSDTVAGFRLSRNVESASVSVTDSDMCNQLYFTLVPTSGSATLEVYNNAASQAAYGVRTKCASLKAEELPAGVTGAEYAEQILSERAEPLVSIQISGYDLASLTGDAFDRITLGSLCQASLPEWRDAQINERVVGLSWPDALGEPERIKVSMANVLSPFTENLSLAKKMAGGVKGAAAKAKEDLSSWSKVVTDTIEAVDGTGLKMIWQSGIDMSAQGGVRIFSLAQGLVSLKSEIEVNKGHIGLLVGSDAGGEAYIKIDAIVDGINGSQASISADHIVLTGGEIKLNEAILVGDAGVSGDFDYLYVEDGHANEFTVNLGLKANQVETDVLLVSDGGGGYHGASWMSKTVVTGISITMPSLSLTSSHDMVYEKSDGTYGKLNGTRVVMGYTAGSASAPTTETIYYLGSASDPSPQS